MILKDNYFANLKAPLRMTGFKELWKQTLVILSGA